VIKKYSRLLLTITFLLMLFITFEFSGMRDKISLAFIQDSFSHHIVLGMAIFIGLYSLGNLIQIPGLVFLGAAVLTLGQFWGAVMTYAAAVVSCCVTYGLITLIGGGALRELKNPLAKRLLSRLDTYPLQTVTILRLLFQSAPTLNYALALTGVSFRRYLLGTLLGLPIPIALYCIFFNYLKVSLT